MEQWDFFKNDGDYYNYLSAITGHDYVFANSSVRRWIKKVENGNFYQVMPASKDDGFFDWYIERSPDQQFFFHKMEAVLRFVKYWIEWKKIV
jgi:hypothetical protein